LELNIIRSNNKDNKVKMRLTDLGEKEIVRRLSKIIPIGDDAAVLEMDKDISDRFIVVSTDMFYEKTHRLPGMTMEQIGNYIVCSNFSDIAAMGARPIAFLLAYGCSDQEFSDFEKVINSVRQRCEFYGARFIGGDTKQTEQLCLTGISIGTTNRPVFRSGANVGDVIAVTGTIGDAGLGVEILLRGIDFRTENSIKNSVIRKAFEPEARVNEGISIGNFATSMTDVSDSLALSLYDVSEQSNVGMEIDLMKLPLSENAVKLADRFGVDILEYALYTGGDYELLFTANPGDIDRINKINATVVGRVTQNGIIAVDGNERIKIRKDGYEHFRKNCCIE